MDINGFHIKGTNDYISVDKKKDATDKKRRAKRKIHGAYINIANKFSSKLEEEDAEELVNKIIDPHIATYRIVRLDFEGVESISDLFLEKACALMINLYGKRGTTNKINIIDRGDGIKQNFERKLEEIIEKRR